MPATTRSRLGSTLALGISLAAVIGTVRADDRAPARGPPPEAYAACDGQQSDAACSVTLGDRTLEGTCASGPDGRLACRPRPSPPPEAFSACEAKQSGDACNVTLGDQTMSGTCAAIEDGRLACRLNGPPPRR